MLRRVIRSALVMKYRAVRMMNLEMRFFSHSFLLLLPSGFSSLPTRGMFANASLPEAWISLFWLRWCSLSRQPRRGADPPRGLFWEKRLQGLSASDVSEQIIKSMELPKGLQGVGPGNNDDTLLSAVASALHTSSAPITGQLSAAVEKNPAVWLNTSQPLCKAFIVTDDDIRKQEERVQQVRKKLEEALMADILSRAADTTKDLEVEMDNGDEA
uniref:Methyl-CpG binding protein 2/3 C-terminal domain-containing protein n=1 Tax=Anas zonorhyncha TaxID=75864 RepID=A0A8B9VYR5_9AVES